MAKAKKLTPVQEAVKNIIQALDVAIMKYSNVGSEEEFLTELTGEMGAKMEGWEMRLSELEADTED